MTGDVEVLDGALAICRLPPGAATPSWAESGAAPLAAMVRTGSELSIVCADEVVPSGTRVERGWRALVVEGPLDFDAIGVLSALASPLAQARIPILALSTFDTDYILVRGGSLERAVAALRAAGHRVRYSTADGT